MDEGALVEKKKSPIVEPLIPNRGPIGNLQGAAILINLGLIFKISLLGLVETRFHIPHCLRIDFHVGRFAHQILVEIQMPSGGIYTSNRVWWAKRPTWKLTLGLRLKLWYHQGIESAMSP